MDKIAELRAKRAKAVDDLSALADKMNADDYVEIKDDQTSYDALKGEIDGYDAKIKRAEEANKLKASTAIIVPGQDAGGSAKSYPLPKRRYGKLAAFKGVDRRP
jgi:HK97 family phage major capsid protein